jgi:hypothetical protein
MKTLQLIRNYLFQYRIIAGIFVLFSFIFASVFSLYNLEVEAVLYASLLCIFFAFLFLLIHFRKFCKQHREREELSKNLLITTNELPKANTLAEKDYQEMILQLKDNCQTIMNQYQNEKSESMDYYTTWVHQIKTPISVMQMILQSEDSDEHRELLVELFRIEQYVEMVLSYLRLDSTSSDFIFKQYKLDDIIRTAIRKFAPQFIRKRIKLQYEAIDCTVITDEKWLLFILEQLLSNALKYTKNGQITISVSEDKILRISDTGIGIAPEDLPRIFEKGFTGYNGRADKKSTGLGLYLSKKAADKLSHTLTVHSVVGKGTTFVLDLQSSSLEVE